MTDTILIVDDDEAYAKSIAALLRQHGLEAWHTISGETALDMLSRRQFDAVLTDIYMPHRDGLELLHAITQLYRGMPVIGMTANNSELWPVIDRIFRLIGGVALLRKPVSASELLTVLTTLPRRQS